jgi:membrane protease YdiL (CAAX protease family)
VSTTDPVSAPASAVAPGPRRRILWPILLFLVVSAIASPLLAMAQDASRIDPDFLRLTVLSTAVGAAAVALAWRLRLPFPPVTRRGWATPLAGSLVAVGLFALVMLALAAAQHAKWPGADLAKLGGAGLPLFLAAQVVGAGAEEVGWRGLVQPLLELRLPRLAAALVTGALFAVGHVFLLPAVGPGPFALFCVSAVAVSVTLAAFTIGYSPVARVAIATWLHFLTNMATFVLFADGDGSARYFADSAVAGALVALAAWLALRRAFVAAPAPEKMLR